MLSDVVATNATASVENETVKSLDATSTKRKLPEAQKDQILEEENLGVEEESQVQHVVATINADEKDAAAIVEEEKFVAAAASKADLDLVAAVVAQKKESISAVGYAVADADPVLQQLN